MGAGFRPRARSADLRVESVILQTSSQISGLAQQDPVQEEEAGAFYNQQSEVEGQYTPEPLSCEKQMALPYLQIADPVRDAIPKVNFELRCNIRLHY